MTPKEWAHDAEIDGVALHPESLMMSHAYRPAWSEGALKPPIFQTSTFVFDRADSGKRFFETVSGARHGSEEPGLIYSRYNNPNLEILEDRLTLWDGAEECAVFASGMAAIATMLLAHLKPGDVLLYSEPLYGGTDRLIRTVLPRWGVQPAAFPAECSGEELERLIAKTPSRALAMIYVETPANPTNQLVDITSCADAARRHSTTGRRVVVAVDNTFLGPLFQHPLCLGADLVLYSATKYIGGHSDVIAGACLGPTELLQPVKHLRSLLGTIADPWTGWLLLRSLETLQLRMLRQAENAARIAAFLADHPSVEHVYYLGDLQPDNPQYAVYRRQCLSAGGMLSFDIVGGEPEAFRFLDALNLVKLAVSLGGTESLADHPASMTHAGVPAEDRERLGILPSMIRLSVGVEHPDDLIHDLGQALAAVGAPSKVR